MLPSMGFQREDQTTTTCLRVNSTATVAKERWWWFSHSVVSDSYNPIDCSPPGSSVHGILQASILEWVAISFGNLLTETVKSK